MKKSLALLFMTGLVAGTAAPLLNANAAIGTDVTNWTWKWDYDSTSGRMEFTDSTLLTNGIRLPFSELLGAYENNTPAGYDYGGAETLPFGFYVYGELQSSTNWVLESGSYYLVTGQQWFGSTSTTANEFKLVYEFNNPTDSYFQIALDLSDVSTSSTFNYVYYTASTPSGIISYGNVLTGTNLHDSRFTRSTTQFHGFWLPPYSKLIYRHVSSSSNFRTGGFQATKVGQSIGYDNGYDVGYDAGYLDGFNSGGSTALESFVLIFSSVMTGIGGIFNIAILGNITLGMLALFPLLGIMIFFFKKVIQ